MFAVNIYIPLDALRSSVYLKTVGIITLNTNTINNNYFVNPTSIKMVLEDHHTRSGATLAPDLVAPY